MLQCDTLPQPAAPLRRPAIPIARVPASPSSSSCSSCSSPPQIATRTKEALANTTTALGFTVPTAPTIRIPFRPSVPVIPSARSGTFRGSARTAVDANEECDGVALASMTVRGKGGRPCTAEAPRETLVQMVRQERAERARAQEAVQGLQAEVQRLGVEVEEHALDVKELEEENVVMQRALRERTDAEKKAERDARMQGVILRSRCEHQKMACDELARRLVEARHEIVAVGVEMKSVQATSSQRDANGEEPLQTFRKRLLQLLSLGGNTTWSETGSRPTTPAVVPTLAEMPVSTEQESTKPVFTSVPAPASSSQQPMPVTAPSVSNQCTQPATQAPAPLTSSKKPAQLSTSCLSEEQAKPSSIVSAQPKQPSTLATCTPTSCDIMSACFQSVFPSSPSEAEHVEEFDAELEFPRFSLEMDLQKQETCAGQLCLQENQMPSHAIATSLDKVVVETLGVVEDTRPLFAHCPSVGSWLRPLPQLFSASIDTVSSQAVNDNSKIATCEEVVVGDPTSPKTSADFRVSSCFDLPRCQFIHMPSVGAWLRAARREELLAPAAGEQESQASQVHDQEVEVEMCTRKVSEDQPCDIDEPLESTDPNSPQVVLVVRLDEEDSLGATRDAFDEVVALESEKIGRTAKSQDDNAPDVVQDVKALSSTSDSEGDSDDVDSDHDSDEEESEEESASEEESEQEAVGKRMCSEADSESMDAIEEKNEDSSDNDTAESDEETDDESQDDSAESIQTKEQQRNESLDDSKNSTEVGNLGEILPAVEVQKAMSETALWRAGILGLESPSSSPCKASVSRPPHAPPFEVAKLSPSLQDRMPNVAKGKTIAQGKDHSLEGSGGIEKSKPQALRSLSEGRIPQRQMDSRVAVSHTHPRQSERQLPDRPIDSLKARAKAPVPLPRHVPPPQMECTLQYAPPARDYDSWQYEKIFPAKDIVQVVRLEGKPYVRKGRKEMEEEIAGRHGKSRMNGLCGIYRPLVQNQERRAPRVQSLPSLPASSRSQHLLRDVQLGSPQRFVGIS
mmetsp:Transcript_92273/g.143940  ORF Transcript_92273/g.143940 Transcript_92273/m.143940 type:complete len:1022 (-) Transcript_92273:41-3106(-)